MPKFPKRKILVVLVTRNRPERAQECYREWLSHSAITVERDRQYTHSDFMVAYDDDDNSYTQEMFPLAIMSKMKPAHLVPALNMRALHYCNDYVAIANIGDDHLIRTQDWDRLMLDRLDKIGGHGTLYPDDCNHGQALATAVVVSSEIIKALGWMGLPSTQHMYTDSAWMRVAEGIGKLEYMPEIVMEHMHPSLGKAQQDALYDRANLCYAADGPAYDHWMKYQCPYDIQRVKAHLAKLK